jgi:hypothetical protein
MRKGDSSPGADPQRYLREDPPFFAFPIQPVHGYDDLPTKHSRKKGQQSRSRGIDMDDVVAAQRAENRENRIADRFEMFGIDRRQFPEPHSAKFWQVVMVVSTAREDSDLVTKRDESCAQFLDGFLDAASRGGANRAQTNEGDSQVFAVCNW